MTIKRLYNNKRKVYVDSLHSSSVDSAGVIPNHDLTASEDSYDLYDSYNDNNNDNHNNDDNNVYRFNDNEQKYDTDSVSTIEDTFTNDINHKVFTNKVSSNKVSSNKVSANKLFTKRKPNHKHNLQVKRTTSYSSDISDISNTSNVSNNSDYSDLTKDTNSDLESPMPNYKEKQSYVKRSKNINIYLCSFTNYRNIMKHFRKKSNT